MKKQFVFIVAFLSMAGMLYAQTPKIDLSLKNVPLKVCLSAIEKQCDYTFMYDNSIDFNQKVTIEAKQENLTVVLHKVFAQVPIRYEIVGKHIMLNPKFESSVNQAEKTMNELTGKVTDEKGQPLPGVTVVVKGTTKGTITNTNGDYSLQNISSNQTLEFSFVGMQKSMALVGDRSVINETMTESATGLNEVVVIGYGTEKKSDLTGSVASVQTKDLPMGGANASSVDQMLEGRVAGLDMDTWTAQPGGSVSVNIRGYLSQLGNNTPLYVIDGVPLTYNENATPGLSGGMTNYDGVSQDPLSTINPSDIESISVLKDASATAIYGSSAANGVVIITTKKGTSGKISVEYRANYTAETPKSFYTINDLLDGHDFMEQHELWANEYYLYQNKIAPYGNTDPSTVAPYVPEFSSTDIQNEGAGYNYMKMIMRNHANSQEHNISLSGGSDYAKIFASFNYYDDNALLIPSTYQRYTGRLNMDLKISSRVNFSVSSNFSSVKSNNAAMAGNGAEQGDMMGAALGFAPTIAPYDAEGNFSKGYIGENPNPLSFLLLQNLSRTNRIFVAPNLEIKILKDLKLNVTGGYDDQTGLRNMYLPIKAQIPYNPDGLAQLYTNTVENQSLESFLTYNKEFKTSRLTIIGGVGDYYSENDGYWVQAKGFTTDAYQDNNIAASNPAMTLESSSKYAVTKLSGYYRVNYSVMDKYIMTLTGREDGSSNFAENHKWGFFPAVSAAWRVSQEPFMKKVTPISDLKLRVSYGASGNDVTGANSLSLYGTIPSATFLIGSTNYSAVTLLQIANPDLTWETDITFNAGLDFSLLNGRISVTYDHFIKTAKNLLSYNTLPYNNPVSRVAANVGTTRSIGNEIDITTKNIITNNFEWSSHITLSHYGANWVKRNPQYVLQPWETEKAPLGAVYGFKTDGIIKDIADIPSYQSNANVGNMKYVKIDKNTSTMGATDAVELYDSNSPWTFGFSNTFNYKKSWDLSVFINGSLNQACWKYQVDGSPLAVAELYNTYYQVKNHWSSFNPSGNLPGIAPDPVNNPTGNTDFGLVKNGWWARIQDISMGYTFPKSILGIKSIRLFIDMQNVAVISPFFKDTDPEYSYTYPPVLSTSFGLDIKF